MIRKDAVLEDRMRGHKNCKEHLKQISMGQGNLWVTVLCYLKLEVTEMQCFGLLKPCFRSKIHLKGCEDEEEFFFVVYIYVISLHDNVHRPLGCVSPG